MNPKLMEEEYYNSLINEYNQVGICNQKEFEIYAYLELLSILNEEKDPLLHQKDRELLQRIRTNTILIFLALNSKRKTGIITNSNTQNKPKSPYVKDMMQALI